MNFIINIKYVFQSTIISHNFSLLCQHDKILFYCIPYTLCLVSQFISEQLLVNIDQTLDLIFRWAQSTL